MTEPGTERAHCTRKCVTIYIVFTASWSGRCILKCVCRKHDYDWIIPCTDGRRRRRHRPCRLSLCSVQKFFIFRTASKAQIQCDEKNEGARASESRTEREWKRESREGRGSRKQATILSCDTHTQNASENDERATDKTTY